MAKVILLTHWDWVLYNYRLPLARALQAEGHQVLLVSPRGDYVGAFFDQGFEWREWQVGRRDLNPLREAGAIAGLTALYRREAPDAVHHFTIKPNLYGSIAARLARVPKVINTFTGLGFVFSEQPRARLIRLAIAPVMRLAFAGERTWTIFQTHADLDRLVSQRIVDARRASVIAGSGVPVYARKPSSNTADSIPIVLMAARLLREKGVADLVEAGRLLERRGVAARVMVAGEPDPGNPDSVTEAELAEWSRTGNVEFLGHRHDMDQLVSRASIAVLPTSYNEGIPKFLLEAAAAGLPLVATNLPGCKMIVRDGVNGALVPAHDPVALADALEVLVKDPALREQYGALSRDLVRESFSEEKVIDAYKEVYRRWAFA